jgi:phenylalanyl-tRNA synthetase alpha chain
VTAELKFEDFKPQVDSIEEAFQQKWERFRYFVLEPDRPEFAAGLDFFGLEKSTRLEKAKVALTDAKELHTEMLGRKSRLAALRKEIRNVEEGHRGVAGQAVTRLETHISQPLQMAENHLSHFISTILVEREAIDVTLPGRRPRRGHLHPITVVRERIEDIFVSLGYAIEDGREIETDFYNFDALNIPDNHPARAPQDTFYTTDGFALRSQTSTVQIHAMQRRGAPLRMIAPGRVFRRDTPDPTHNPMFFQVEGLCVNRGISMAHLKGTVAEFLRRMFGEQTVTRFRPSYFPFTEPSAEFDFSCFKCGGSGCRICKHSGWIELGGSGMVHPNVLRVAGVDPEEFSGFAFGLGIDRMVGLMYGLDDIRLLFENDVRFLEQFD